jgi:methyl-accepting chemotaxis protein
LTLGFGVVLALLVALALLSWCQQDRTLEQLRRMAEQESTQGVLVSTMQQQVNAVYNAALAVVVLSDPEDIKDQKLAVVKALKAYDATETALGQLLATRQAGDLLTQMETVRRSAALARRPLEQLMDMAGDPADRDRVSSSIANGVKPLFDDLQRDVAQLAEVQRDAMLTASNQALAQAAASRYALFVFALLAVGVALTTGWSISRGIALAIGDAVAMAERVAAGDLSGGHTRAWPGELGLLSDGLRRMQGGLRALVSEVSASARGIASASREIATGNLDLSNRTEQTASQLQHAASALDQVNGALAQTAESVKAATGLAESAAGAARHGHAAVTRAIATMGEIGASSSKISDITGVIDGIAFQTNILALNAAVEAARAGEQGKGFAVVAAEVRTLAQSSAQAARQIRELIQGSVSQIVAGQQVVNATGQAMQDILGRVDSVSRVIEEIRAAAQAQSADVREISGAVVQLDDMTQRNASLVEQSTAAADGMHQQTERLLGLVATFRLDHHEADASV